MRDCVYVFFGSAIYLTYQKKKKKNVITIVQINHMVNYYVKNVYTELVGEFDKVH